MRTLNMGGLLAAIAVSLVAPPEAASQERQPVVLQHGFMSDSTTWDATAPWLERYLYVATTRHSTGANSSFARQVNRLRERIAHLPDTTILIGHSNGGLISRRIATIRPTKGFITIGTPHQGAPLAANLLNGNVGALAWLINYAARDVIDAYTRPEYESRYSRVGELGLWAARAQEVFAHAIYTAAASMNLMDGFGETVLTDMGPGSPFLSSVDGINSFDALHQEAATVGGPRVALQTTVRASYFREWMIWKGLYPQYSAQLSLVTDATVVSLLIAFDYYASYYDPGDWYAHEKRAMADRWLWAAGALWAMDMSWCGLIGAGGFDGCQAADGIVPVARAEHPGAGVHNLRLVGPAHQEQINSQEFRTAVFDALQHRFQVRYPDASAPQPLRVRIEGTEPWIPGAQINTAYASGGTGSYTYRWYVSGDGNYFEDTGVTSNTYEHRVEPRQMFWIMVIVSSGGDSVSATKALGPVCEKVCQ